MWSLDTSDPSRDNLKFVSMIDVSNLDRWYKDCDRWTTYNEYVQLNERFVCIVQLKENMMSYQFDTFRIHVFIHNLQKCNQFEFRSEIQQYYLKNIYHWAQKISYCFHF